MPVDTRHLAALVAVVEEGSFARAAQSLGFTQSPPAADHFAELALEAGRSVLQPEATLVG